ncbi:MAG TPA: Ricin and poly(3-hydroxybutyrate) depolymerase fusion [Polyangiaceae bacterium]|nr:Ricin and poly(3-hydroxybutyrate) depolymerase fusion [Polyangiaceae bacterium]
MIESRDFVWASATGLVALVASVACGSNEPAAPAESSGGSHGGGAPNGGASAGKPSENGAGGVSGSGPSGGADASGGASGSLAGAGSSGGTGGGSGSGGAGLPASGGNGAVGGDTGAAAGMDGMTSGTSGGGGVAGAVGGAGVGGSSGGEPTKSVGCGKSTGPESGRYSIDVAGTAREYILEVPPDYDSSQPYRLVFAWHGRMYSAETVAAGETPPTGPYYGLASEAGGSAIFVAPQALESGWTNANGRDIAFTDAMLERLESELCIDTSRVFSTGFSFGAIMTLALGCERGDVFRAIAPLSGSLMNGCPDPERPVAYFSAHGSADTTIPLASGEAARDEFLARNGCSSESVPVSPDGCVRYEGCTAGYPVVFCVFDGAHEPPPYAGEAIWRFFEEL